MAREMCYRCFWPKSLCWCGSIIPMPTRTLFVFLMHPKEWKQEKAATGRLTHLSLPNSVIHIGTEFDAHAGVQSLIADAANFPVLLYPGRDALNLSDGHLTAAALNGRRLAVFLLDATWSLGRKMLRLSPSLQRLPRIMITPPAPSRYVIKQQPHPGCLSTLEAAHELLLALERSGLDEYSLPTQLLELFGRMQDFQIRCATDPARAGYRRHGYRSPSLRQPFRGASATRRAKIFQAPGHFTRSS
ncbi:MAG: tRNA-uridine aminocarboxypropyltransferase [Opitutus sp.]